MSVAEKLPRMMIYHHRIHILDSLPLPNKNLCDFHSLPPADDIPRVNNARDPTENAQADIDEEVGTASSFENDSNGREEDGQEVEADIAC